jgi:hAT family C-terminal dimerisation region
MIGLLLCLDCLQVLLNQVAPSAVNPTRYSMREDQLALYLDEPLSQMGVMDYWRSREFEWPQLAKMAFDFLAVPAMSAECERVFSSCVKLTTPEISRLPGRLLWHQMCLKNWQQRGAIIMGRAWNGVPLDLDP